MAKKKADGWESRYRSPDGGHSTGMFGHWVGMTFYPALVRARKSYKAGNCSSSAATPVQRDEAAGLHVPPPHDKKRT